MEEVLIVQDELNGNELVILVDFFRNLSLNKVRQDFTFAARRYLSHRTSIDESISKVST